MSYPNNVKHLLTILTVLMSTFIIYVVWWMIHSAEVQERFERQAERADREIQALTVALEEANRGNPSMDVFEFSFNVGNVSFTVVCTDIDEDRVYSCTAAEI